MIDGIRVFSLYSGSTGNAFLISSPNTNLLIDAGKNAKKLCAALDEVGVSPDRIDGIVVTHEHNDHISALPVFLHRHPTPVHIVTASSAKLSEDPYAAPCLHLHPPIYEETIGSFRVKSFPTPHDSRGSVGYRIEIPCGDSVFTVGYATDIGYVSQDVTEGLTGCDAVILESNHDPEMLWYGPYPEELKYRISSRRGHLSNPDCARFAATLCGTGTRHLMLAHLSMENNTPETAYAECFSAIADERVELCVAAPDAVTEMVLCPCEVKR